MALQIPDTFELIPADDDPVRDLDEELAVVDDEGLESGSTPEQPAPFGRTWLFDPETKRMVTYGQGPVEVSGIESVKQIVLAVMGIKRFEHPIFSDAIGLDDPERLLGWDFSAERNDEYAQDISEALLAAHERITDVRNFRFDYDPDDTFVDVSFDVEIDNEESVPISTVRVRF